VLHTGGEDGPSVALGSTDVEFGDARGSCHDVHDVISGSQVEEVDEASDDSESDVLDLTGDVGGILKRVPFPRATNVVGGQVSGDAQVISERPNPSMPMRSVSNVRIS